MAKVIAREGNYKILREQKRHEKPFIVVRDDGTYEQHAHFATLKGAYDCLTFIEKHQRPTTAYMFDAVKRLVGVEIFDYREKRLKPRYLNRR